MSDAPTGSSNRNPRGQRARARGRRRPGGRIALSVLGVALLLAGAWFSFQYVQSRRVTLQFVHGGGPVPAIELVFFPDQLAFSAPSPPPPIGRLLVAGGASVTVGSDLVPEHAVVRYAGMGIGTGFQHLQLGQPTAVLPLRPPQVLAGRVVEPIAAWCFGWRCIALHPVGQAEVVVMGGGEHGIELATVRSDPDGGFRFEGLDLALDGIGLRVRAPGFAIAHVALPHSAGTTATTEVPLVKTNVRRGRIVAPPDVDLTKLRVLARGLPGVEARPSVDGAFELDHVPIDTQPRLLLHGLTGLLCHTPVRATSEPLQIDVVLGAAVRGQVVDATTRAPMAMALVFFGDDHAVRADGSGHFELAPLVPGTIEIQAQFDMTTKRRRTVSRSGRLRVRLEAGKTLDGVVIAVE